MVTKVYNLVIYNLIVSLRINYFITFIDQVIFLIRCIHKNIK